MKPTAISSEQFSEFARIVEYCGLDFGHTWVAIFARGSTNRPGDVTQASTLLRALSQLLDPDKDIVAERIEMDRSSREAVVRLVQLVVAAVDYDESVCESSDDIYARLSEFLRKGGKRNFSERLYISELRIANLDYWARHGSPSYKLAHRRVFSLTDAADLMLTRNAPGDARAAICLASSAHFIAHGRRNILMMIRSNIALYAFAVARHVAILERAGQEHRAKEAALILSEAVENISENGTIRHHMMLGELGDTIRRLASDPDESVDESLDTLGAESNDSDDDVEVVEIVEDSLDAHDLRYESEADLKQAEEMVERQINALGILASLCMPDVRFDEKPSWDHRSMHLTPVALAARAAKLARNAACAMNTRPALLGIWVEALLIQCEVGIKTSYMEATRSVHRAELAYQIAQYGAFEDDLALEFKSRIVDVWYSAAQAGDCPNYDYYKRVLRIGLGVFCRRSALNASDTFARRRALFYLEMLHHASEFREGVFDKCVIAPYRKASDIAAELFALDSSFLPDDHLQDAIRGFDVATKI